MKKHYFLIKILLLATLFFSGCDRPTTQQSNTNLSIDNCSIALIPHQATDQTDIADIEIIRRQKQIQGRPDQQGKNFLAQMERLGWAYVKKARSSFDPGFYHLAEQVAFCIQSNVPKSFDALLLRGHVLHNLHQFKQAERLAQTLADQRGLWFDYALLGDVLTEQGRLEEAVTVYQKMMDQRPGPQAYSRAAHVRWLTGDLSGAIDMMQLATRASDPRDPESAAWFNVRLAFYQFQKGEYQQAADLFSTAQQLYPDYAPALLGQGRLLLAQGEIKKAVDVLTKATKKNPLPEYQWILIDSLRLDGNKQRANILESALLDKGEVEDPRTLAIYLATIGQHSATAVALAKKELTIREDVFTLDALAWALNADGKHKEAYEFIQRALAEKTPDARLYFHAGVIALANGDTNKAQLWFNNVLPFRHMLLPSEQDSFDREIVELNRISQSSSTRWM